MKRPFLVAFLFPIPLIARFLTTEYNVAKSGKFQKLYEYQNDEVKKQIK